jgi:hypothetical protein
MMSERPTTRAPATDRKPARKIPPLLWIVLAIFVAWFVVAMLQRGGTHVTPQGGTMPQASEGTSVMPAAPAGPGAPATPAGTVNGPAQPPANGAAAPQ